MSRKKRYIEKLTEEQKSSLEKGYKTGKTHMLRRKCRSILLSDSGKSIPEIAVILETTRHSIYIWFNIYEKQGLEGLLLKPGRGRKRKLSLDNESQVKKIKKALTKDAQDLNKLLAELEEEFNLPMSKKTLKRFLKNLVTDGNVFENE